MRRSARPSRALHKLEPSSLLGSLNRRKEVNNIVTARFKVTRVTPMGYSTAELEAGKEPYAYEVEMTPDYANGANKDWSEATPNGVCRLTITNKAAVDKLPLGASLELTFKQL
jgi:hypothetical protein